MISVADGSKNAFARIFAPVKSLLKKTKELDNAIQRQGG